MEGSKVPAHGEGTGRGHGGADVLLEGLSLPVPTVPSTAKTRPGICVVLEGPLEDGAVTGSGSPGRYRTGLGDPRAIGTVPAAATCACQQINRSKCYSSLRGRQNVYIICTSLKSFRVTY